MVGFVRTRHTLEMATITLPRRLASSTVIRNRVVALFRGLPLSTALMERSYSSPARKGDLEEIMPVLGLILNLDRMAKGENALEKRVG